MSTSTIARTVSARWLHSGIAIGSTLLIVAAIASVLLLRSASGATPAAGSIPAVAIYTPLDQHERHLTDLPSSIHTPLDQHERHPELFDASGEKEAGARDRWWADPKEDDSNAARDAWWLDK